MLFAVGSSIGGFDSVAGRVAVTGAGGFIGRFLLPVLQQGGWSVRAWVRIADDPPIPGVEYVSGDLRDGDSADRFVNNADVVIHLAGRAHLLAVSSLIEKEMFEINLDATLQLARKAADARVRRFVFVSSIGVLGSQSPQVLTEASCPSPESAYAQSKLEAEQQLFAISRARRMEVTVLRPTLVFGPGAPGNVDRLVRLVARGVPLPFGLVRARRSFIGVRNLVDLLAICCRHPEAAGEVFLAADDPPMALPELIAIIGAGLRKPAPMLPVPQALLRLGAGIFGKAADMARLTSALIVDAGKARAKLGWCPHQTLHDAVQETAAFFCASRPLSGQVRAS